MTPGTESPLIRPFWNWIHRTRSTFNSIWRNGCIAQRLISGRHLERFSDRNRIVLAKQQPTSVLRIPSGLEAPLYGELSFGPRENPTTFTFLLDEPDGKPSRLWVDRNGNADLTDDPPVEWTFVRR